MPNLYNPRAVSRQSIESLARSVDGELRRLSTVLEAIRFDTLVLEEQNVEPDKKISDVALFAFADGTNWNPGSGAGLYAYIGGVWTLVTTGSLSGKTYNDFI